MNSLARGPSSQPHSSAPPNSKFLSGRDHTIDTFVSSMTEKHNICQQGDIQNRSAALLSWQWFCSQNCRVNLPHWAKGRGSHGMGWCRKELCYKSGFRREQQSVHDITTSNSTLSWSIHYYSYFIDENTGGSERSSKLSKSIHLLSSVVSSEPISGSRALIIHRLIPRKGHFCPAATYCPCLTLYTWHSIPCGSLHVKAQWDSMHFALSSHFYPSGK